VAVQCSNYVDMIYCDNSLYSDMIKSLESQDQHIIVDMYVASGHITQGRKSSCHPTYPLGAGAELKGGAVVGLCKIYIASALLYCRGLCACFSGHARH